jgi:hypothetical protein
MRVVRAITGSPGLFFFASTGCERVAFIIELDEEFADACEFFADKELAVLLFPCAPFLLTLAEVPLVPEEPAWLLLR